MENFGERLAFARKQKGLKQDDVAARFKINRVNISQWESNITKPEASRLPALAEMLGVTVDWLLSGTGDAPDKQPKTRGKTAAKQGGLIDEIDLVGGLGGGGIAALEQSNHNGITFAKEVVRDQWRLPEWIMNRMNVRASHVAAFPVKGDSMEPTIADGDVVFIDTRHRVPSPPGIYALADEFGGVVVKRLEVTSRPGEETITVRIASDNPHHNDRELTLPEIYIIGRYIGRFTI